MHIFFSGGGDWVVLGSWDFPSMSTFFFIRCHTSVGDIVMACLHPCLRPSEILWMQLLQFLMGSFSYITGCVPRAILKRVMPLLGIENY